MKDLGRQPVAISLSPRWSFCALIDGVARISRIQYGDEDRVVDLHHGLDCSGNVVGIATDFQRLIHLSVCSCSSGRGPIALVGGGVLNTSG